MTVVNQTTGEVLRSDPSAEARRGNPTTTDESLRMVISPLSQRLKDDNFLMWKYQIENVVRGYGLEGFLFGTEQVPPKMVTDGTGILVSNPKFKDYQRQDHLLISWLLSSIESAFLPHVQSKMVSIYNFPEFQFSIFCKGYVLQESNADVKK